jgi:tetratricopeptide (TPR) repeat protein
MCRNIIVCLIVFSMSRCILALSADEPSEMLAKAEALYYEADFEKSVAVLSLADDLLRQQPGQIKTKADVKLQLALGLIGLNDNTRAKAYMDELYALDPDYPIDPQMFSPKVIRLADDAKREQNERRCRSVSEEAQRQVETGNADAVLKLIDSGQQKCSGLAALAPKAGDLFFKEGLAAYKNAQMEEALRKFGAALRLNPNHDLAAQYADLTLSKLEVAADRAIITWRNHFDAGDFSAAAADYRQVTALASSAKIQEVGAGYRQALSSLIESWNAACEKNDTAAMESIRVQINALLPEPSFAEDLLAQIKMCSHEGCLHMDTPVALARLKTRVDPQFSNNVLVQFRNSQITIRVKTTIDEKGDVTGTEMSGNNPVLVSPIRTAMAQWKFLPAVVGAQARCVETEIPILINWSRN